MLVWWIGARGLLRTTALAGHDSAAYPITQHQFMENLRAGVLFPRWAPDMRFGYGHPQLQYRPPLLHYAATPIHALSGNPFLAVNLATALFMAIGLLGMYRLARTFAGRPESVLAAAGYLLANYPLANTYLRGAYYEVTAMGCLPWILWAQTRAAAPDARVGARGIPAGALAWLGALTGHPAIAFFFAPVALAQALWLAWRHGRRAGGRCAAAFALGVLLSAPYTWGLYSERPWVRMEIFMSELETWRPHFIGPATLLRERWPDDYRLYERLDIFQRPRHREMRGLNTWAWLLLFAAPLTALWLTHRRRPESAAEPDNQPEPHVSDAAGRLVAAPLIVLYGIAMALPLSLPIWRRIGLMETFNFPWRALTVASLGLALTLAALPAAWRIIVASSRRDRHNDAKNTTARHPQRCVMTANPGSPSQVDRASGLPAIGFAKAGPLRATAGGLSLYLDRWLAPGLALFLLIWVLIDAAPHTGGWAGPDWLAREPLTGEMIRQHPGIPLQYYTPRWVGRYATAPAEAPGWVVAGGPARLRLVQRSPIRWQLAIEAEAPARLALAHYHYPGWRIEGLPDGRQPSEPWTDRGLISFSVPAGDHTVTLRFANVGRRWFGWFLFALGGLGLVVERWLQRRPRITDDVQSKPVRAQPEG